MKKIVLATLILFGLNAGAFAQAAPVKKEQPKMQAVKKAEPQKRAKVVPIKATPAQPATTGVKPTTPTKPAVPASAKMTSPGNSRSAPGHLKKDGTPDKRYKENKHVKKDGTPDKRFKENKG